MREYHGEEKPCCYFHPMQVTVGVCSVCLKERLQVLASKKGRHLLPQTGATATERSLRRLSRNYSSINIRKVFALGSIFLHLSHSHKNKDVHSHDQSCSISSLEDSFISIKFEENGHASWQTKKTINAIPSTSITCGSGIGMAKDSKGVIRRRSASGVVHTKKHDDGALQWRKRIGRLLQLARWNKSNKASSGHVAFGKKMRGTRGGGQAPETRKKGRSKERSESS